MEKKKKKIHTAWYMLIGCCLLQGGSLGIVHNCRSVFFTPVIEELGFSSGAFSFYMLFFGVCSCVFMPFLSRIFDRFDTRILLSVSTVIFCGTVAAMGTFHSLVPFYIAGAVQGLSGAFLMFYPGPLILGNWFKKDSGLAIGISSAFSGAVGVAGSPLAARLIESFGWRQAYLQFSLIALAMMLPVSALLLRHHPSDMNMKAYGEEGEEGEETGALSADTALIEKEAKSIKSSRPYILILAAGVLASFTTGFSIHISPIATTAGFTAALGATMVALYNGGNVVSKIVLGRIYDRRGLRAAQIISAAMSGAGFLLLLSRSRILLAAGSLFAGCCCALNAMLAAVTIKDVYGMRYYSSLLPFSSMITTCGSAVSMTLIGCWVDLMGSERGYRQCTVAGAVIVLGMLALFIVSSAKGKRFMEQEKIVRE